MMTTEVASFSTYPGAWIVWGANLACVLVVVVLGVSLALKNKGLILLPLVLGFAATHGFRWFMASLRHDYPIPTVATVQSVVDDQGRYIPLISHSARVDPIAWGAALTVLLAAAVEKRRANKRPEGTEGKCPPSKHSQPPSVPPP